MYLLDQLQAQLKSLGATAKKGFDSFVKFASEKLTAFSSFLSSFFYSSKPAQPDDTLKFSETRSHHSDSSRSIHSLSDEIVPTSEYSNQKTDAIPETVDLKTAPPSAEGSPSFTSRRLTTIPEKPAAAPTSPSSEHIPKNDSLDYLSEAEDKINNIKNPKVNSKPQNDTTVEKLKTSEIKTKYESKRTEPKASSFTSSIYSFSSKIKSKLSGSPKPKSGSKLNLKYGEG